MLSPVRKVYDWACLKAFSPRAHWWVGLIFLTEAVLFLPLDGILMLFCMQNPKRRFTYALMATLASTLTALLGYGVGFLLWDTLGPYIVGHLISADFFARLVGHYNEHSHLAVFAGSLLPLPFKAVTLSAGFCQLTLSSFMIFVFFARAIRFFLLAEMMRLWGESIKSFIDRHFNRIIIALGAKIALTFTFFWVLGS